MCSLRSSLSLYTDHFLGLGCGDSILEKLQADRLFCHPMLPIGPVLTRDAAGAQLWGTGHMPVTRPDVTGTEPGCTGGARGSRDANAARPPRPPCRAPPPVNSQSGLGSPCGGKPTSPALQNDLLGQCGETGAEPGLPTPAPLKLWGTFGPLKPLAQMLVKPGHSSVPA